MFGRRSTVKKEKSASSDSTKSAQDRGESAKEKSISPYLEKANSHALTKSMKAAIRSMSDGDYFIIRNIKAIERRYKIEYDLDPFYTFLRGKTSVNSELYAKISWSPASKKMPIFTESMIVCAETLDSMCDGMVDFYQTTEKGFIRKEFVYKDSLIVQKSLFDEL